MYTWKTLFTISYNLVAFLFSPNFDLFICLIVSHLFSLVQTESQTDIEDVFYVNENLGICFPVFSGFSWRNGGIFHIADSLVLHQFFERNESFSCISTIWV